MYEEIFVRHTGLCFRVYENDFHHTRVLFYTMTDSVIFLLTVYMTELMTVLLIFINYVVVYITRLLNINI